MFDLYLFVATLYQKKIISLHVMCVCAQHDSWPKRLVSDTAGYLQQQAKLKRR